MIEINQEIFRQNLSLTQQYCERQLSNADKNFASILRSINVKRNGLELFKFSLYKVSCQTPFYTFGADWRLDPFDTPNLIENLFKEQILLKQKQPIQSVEVNIYEGNILAFKIDETLIDGAAAVSSYGLLDDFNCPPIDTWFYLTKDMNSRVLLAWIPIQLVNYVNYGISVNPENCIDWLGTWYPNEMTEIEKYNKTTKLCEFINGLPVSFSR